MESSNRAAISQQVLSIFTAVDAVLLSVRTSANRDCQPVLRQRIQRPNLDRVVSLYSDRLKRPLFVDVTV